jgi:hypothetical protein
MKELSLKDFLDKLQSFSDEKKWDEIESYFYEYCLYYSSEEIAESIKKAQLDKYREAIEILNDRALGLAKQYHAKAVYFEYDLDNQWDSGYCICEDYASREEGDDDWAADFMLLDDELDFYPVVEFGEFEFADYYRGGFMATSLNAAVNFYLIARTTALFGKMNESKDWGSIVLCIGFHDQEIVTRISDPNL